MSRIVVIGYKGTDLYLKQVLEHVEHEEQIPMGSLEGKVIRYMTAERMKACGRKISQYKRLYCVVGTDIKKQLHNNEERFLKTLRGDALVDVVWEFQPGLRNLIDVEKKRMIEQRKYDTKTNQINYELRRLYQSTHKLLKKYHNLKDESIWKEQYDAEAHLTGLTKRFEQLKEDIDKNTGIGELRANVNGLWLMSPLSELDKGGHEE